VDKIVNTQLRNFNRGSDDLKKGKSNRYFQYFKELS